MKDLIAKLRLAERWFSATPDETILIKEAADALEALQARFESERKHSDRLQANIASLQGQLDKATTALFTVTAERDEARARANAPGN